MFGKFNLPAAASGVDLVPVRRRLHSRLRGGHLARPDRPWGAPTSRLVQHPIGCPGHRERAGEAAVVHQGPFLVAGTGPGGPVGLMDLAVSVTWVRGALNGGRKASFGRWSHSSHLMRWAVLDWPRSGRKYEVYSVTRVVAYRCPRPRGCLPSTRGFANPTSTRS